MPCQKLPLGQDPSGTGYDSIEDCEQRCCGNKPKCPETPDGQCCPEGETCLETYASNFFNGYTCCKPENVCQGTDSSGYPYSACFGDGVECIIE